MVLYLNYYHVQMAFRPEPVVENREGAYQGDEGCEGDRWALKQTAPCFGALSRWSVIRVGNSSSPWTWNLTCMLAACGCNDQVKTRCAWSLRASWPWTNWPNRALAALGPWFSSSSSSPSTSANWLPTTCSASCEGSREEAHKMCSALVVGGWRASATSRAL